MRQGLVQLPHIVVAIGENGDSHGYLLLDRLL